MSRKPYVDVSPLAVSQLDCRLVNYLDYSVSSLESPGLRRRPVFYVSDVQSSARPLRRQNEPEPIEVRPQSEPTQAKSGSGRRFHLIISSPSTCHAVNYRHCTVALVHEIIFLKVILQVARWCNA